MMKAIYFKSTFDKSGGYPVIYGTFENLLNKQHTRANS